MTFEKLANGTNDGTYVNGVTLSAAGPSAALPKAADFDGSNDYVGITDNATLHQADGPLTLEAWIRGDSWTGGVRAIMGKSTNGYLLYVDATGHLVLAKRFVADIVKSTTTMSTGTWYHVAATKSGSTTHLYIDGVDVTGTVTDSTLADTTTALGFGTERGDQSASPFDGRMAGVAVFGRVLSASEVLEDYAAAAADVHAPATPTGLTVTAGGPDREVLSWTASTDNLGVAGYKIYRAGSYLTTVGSTSWTDLGRTAATSYGYTVSAIDAAGNESSQTGSSSATTGAASVTTSYTYDASGNKLTASDGTFTITSTYDRLNRVLTTDDEDAGTTADTTYTYSFASPAWTDPTGTYGATLDKFDRVTDLNDPADSTDFTSTYRADGQPATMVQPDGNTTTFGYDDAEHLISKYTTASGPTNRALYDWTVNAAGSILSEASTVTGDASNGTITYGYDALGQLTGSTLSATTTAYAWDKVTNRTSVQVGAGTATTTTFDAANRPTAGTNPALSYANDADGRLTARTGQTMTYDHLGRLTAVKDASGTITLAAYTYDPLDRLRMIDYGGGTRIRFRYVGMTTSVAQWIDDAAGTVTRNVGNGWDGQHLLDWTGTNANIRIYGENNHHDVTWLASSTGTVSQALRYDPWGNPRAAVPGGYTPFRFQGSYYDATTDLSWVITRWYAPLQGRFVSEDTLLGTPADPPSRQLYAYAQGDPIGAWDPNGEDQQPAHGYRAFHLRTFPHGKIVVGLFIAEQFVNLPGNRTYGDNRSWSAPGRECAHSRGCITVDFDRRLVTLTVNPTCTDVGPIYFGGFYIGYQLFGCNSAFPIRQFGTCGVAWDDRCNLLYVGEQNGTLNIKWDVTQSRLPIVRPDLTVNGSMEIYPAAMGRGPKVAYHGEGFPSEEMYYYQGGSRFTIFRHEEGGFYNMASGLGDWHTTKFLPTSSWDGPGHA